MKKLLIVVSILLSIVPRGTFAQTATNNVRNVATIFATNSPVTFNAMITASNANFSGTITNNGAVVASMLVTNTLADFPLIAAAAFSDLSYPLTGTITNMSVSLGRPASEEGSLAVDGSVPSNGFIRLRARNIGAIAVDQGNLPYRVQVTKSPTQ